MKKYLDKTGKWAEYSEYEKALKTIEATQNYMDFVSQLSGVDMPDAGEWVDFAAHAIGASASELQYEALEKLGELYPGLISQYDAENGRLEEKLRLIKEIAEAEQKLKIAELESSVIRGRQNFSQINEKVQSSEEKQQGWDKEIQDWYGVKDMLMGLQADYLAVGTANATGVYDWDKGNEELDKLNEQIKEINAQTGWTFRPQDFQNDRAIKAVSDEIEKLLSTIEKERVAAEEWISQYQKQYFGELELINAQQYGGGLTGDINKWNELNQQLAEFNGAPTTETQQAILQEYEALNEKLAPYVDQIRDLNEQFGLIPENIKVNIDVHYNETRSTSSITGFVLPPKPHAWGGIMTSPHMGLVAEDGAEAIIPLSGKHRSRGLSLWERAGELLGVRPYADGDIITPTPLPAFNNTSNGAPITIPVTIDNITMDVDIDAGSAADTNSIIAVLKENIKTLTDEIAQNIALSLQQAFANMPKAAE